MLWWLLGSLGLTGGGIGIAALLGGGPFMLMAAKWLWGWLSHATFLQVVCVALALFGAVQTLRVATEQRHARKADAQLIKCSTGREEDRRAFVKGQADAAAANIAHNAADKAARERITNDVSQSYEAQLASLRADLARRLHAQPATSQGAPGQSGLPGVSPSPGGADGQSRVSIPSSLYVRGAELELQLEQLQHWINEQVKVDPNKP